MKKIFALFFCAMFFCSIIPVYALEDKESIDIWDGKTVNEEWGNHYDSSTLFDIESAADFIKLRNMVLEGKDFSGKTIRLNTDIDFNGHNLKYGVGSYTETDSAEWYKCSTLFCGNFDGNFHIIKNVKMDQNEDDAVLGPGSPYGENRVIGLFFKRGGSVSNLGIENIRIVFQNNAAVNLLFGGALCSSSYQSPVKSCYVKNAVFSGGNAVTGSPRIGVLSGYHREATMGDCYAYGVDISGLNMNAAQIGALAYAETESTVVENCYTANVERGSAIVARFSDGLLNYEAVSATNIYSESGVPGSLEEALADVAGKLGDGFTDLKSRGLMPVLAWEHIPDPFTYETIQFYSGYGTAEVEVVETVKRDMGEITAVIKGLKNNTGFTLGNAQLSFSCINDRRLSAHNAVSVELPALSSIDEIVIPLNLVGVEIGNEALIQLIGYKDMDLVVPIFNVKRIENQ